MAANLTNALISTIDEVKDIGSYLADFRVGELLKYTAPLTWALACIYFGSYRSLSNKTTLETLNSNMAFTFPWIASIVLFTLYIFMKFFHYYLFLLLDIYFFLLSTVSTFFFIHHSLVKVFGFADVKKASSVWSLKIPLVSQPLRFTSIHVLNGLLSISFVSWYIIKKHWIANNIIATFLAIQMIQIISLERYKVACMLLVGLFFYDIFWVFATNVMVTVSKSFALPIKFLFPRDIFASNFDFSILGLGDVIIPGWFLALLLRYDAHRKKQNRIQLFTLSYFGYAFGLCLTMYIVYVSKHAQPALLYLVPFSILPSLIGAFVSGEIGMLLNYRDNQAISASPKRVSEKSS